MAPRANVFDCIDACNISITITSGISGISLVHEKPNILLGKNGLWKKGAAYEVFSRNELEETILQALEKKTTADMKKKWIDYVARTTKHYSFSFSEDVESKIGRNIEAFSFELMKYMK